MKSLLVLLLSLSPWAEAKNVEIGFLRLRDGAYYLESPRGAKTVAEPIRVLGESAALKRYRDVFVKVTGELAACEGKKKTPCLSKASFEIEIYNPLSWSKKVGRRN